MCSKCGVAALLLSTACLASQEPQVHEATAQLQSLKREHLQTTEDGKSPDAMDKSLFELRNASRCNIFTLWEYYNTPHFNNRLVVEGWRRHSDGLCNEPILLDDSNVKLYIPDMPDEFFRLDQKAEKSDIVRYASLYHHGGIYMDTDMLVQKDIDPVFELLKHHEVVSYTNAYADANNTCQGKFSSNFIAGRKGSKLLKKIWEKQKEALRNHCPAEGFDEKKNCCFDDADRVCHIPWAGLGEGIAHKVAEPSSLNELTYCIGGNESFTPEGIEDILFKKMRLTNATEAYRKREVQKPFDRMAYHLFNQISVMYEWQCDDLKKEDDFMGTLHRQSFATGRGRYAISRDRNEETKQWHARYPYFANFSSAEFNGRLPC